MIYKVPIADVDGIRFEKTDWIFRLNCGRNEKRASPQAPDFSLSPGISTGARSRSTATGVTGPYKARSAPTIAYAGPFVKAPR